MLKRSYWFGFIILIILIIFLGILAVTAGINWVRNKSNINNNPTTNELPKLGESEETQSARKTYTAASGWTVDYPFNWTIDDSDNFVMFGDKQFVPDSEDNGILTIAELSGTTMEEQREEFTNYFKIEKEEGIYAGSIYGTVMDGEVKPGAASKFESGYRQSIALMPLGDKILKFTLNDSERRNIWLGMIYSLKTNIAEKNPTTNKIGKKSIDGNIIVFTPTEGEKISSPYVLTGSARVFENVINYELTDEDGKVLASGIANALATDIGQYGDFSVSFSYVSSAKNGTLSVFAYSAKDGSKQDLVQIEVEL
ncbi:MAG: Gmad2 immunoglobulin-like domain-containing protein [Patescibacteria group bacterium]